VVTNLVAKEFQRLAGFHLVKYKFEAILAASNLEKKEDG